MVANQIYRKHVAECASCRSVDAYAGGIRCKQGRELIRAADKELKANSGN